MIDIKDLTDRFNTSKYMRAGVDWRLNRVVDPVEAIIIHHTAGWYGGIGVNLTPAIEEAQIEALARDHHDRFGIGPGYQYAVFPSGRVYAIGKSGTHRAHTKGRNPLNKALWNRRSIGIVAFGNYQTNAPTVSMVRGIRAAVNEVRNWTGNRALPIYWHRDVPTVTRSGLVYTQQTECCGQKLIEALIVGQDVTPEQEPEVEEAWISNQRTELLRLQGLAMDIKVTLSELGNGLKKLYQALPDEHGEE